MTSPPRWLQAARDHWQWRGQARPPFATVPAAGQSSVWDFPRPPRVVLEAREVVVHWGTHEIARTQRAVCVQETSHPPSFYLPWADVSREFLKPANDASSSFCEFKGPARYWDLVDAHSGHRLPNIAWSYPQPLVGAEALADCVAFYPAQLNCTVGGETVSPQPGGFYGGWITPELVGPFKGEAGSQGW